MRTARNKVIQLSGHARAQGLAGRPDSTQMNLGLLVFFCITRNSAGFVSTKLIFTEMFFYLMYK